MPTYEYQCEKCQRVFEVRQRITEAALSTCDVCGGRVKRLLSPAPFILKGEGWYVTDYPSDSRKKAKEAEKSTSNGSAEYSTSFSEACAEPVLTRREIPASDPSGRSRKNRVQRRAPA